MDKVNEINKQQLAGFGRVLTQLFTRSFMYSANHPFQIEAMDSTYQALNQLLQSISPVVFILNGEKFYIDEESLDPRLNISKILFYFKKTGIESISFFKGVGKKEFQEFFKIATSLEKFPDADAMIRELFKKRIEHIKINYIFYKKVSSEDEVIPRDFLDKVTPDIIEEDRDRVKEMFIDSVFNSVLQDEFIKKLNLNDILISPDNASKEMIASDIANVRKYNTEKTKKNKNGELRHGQFLLHQLELIDQDVDKKLTEGDKIELSQITNALLDMRKKLIEGIEAQKTLGIAYVNEEKVLSKSCEITDKVLISLIKEEYRKTEDIPRLAQILCRIIPEADELKRLLPQIKGALLKEGMSQDDFTGLIQEFGKVLQNDNLVKILSESAEEIGVEGEDIIRRLKDNPLQSAEMIYLASEIKKRKGDEKAITQLIVDYVEEISLKYSHDLKGKDRDDSERQFEETRSKLKSSLVKQLSSLDIEDELLIQLEERINNRMDEIFNKMRRAWINAYSGTVENKPQKRLTVLETLEQGVNEDENLGKILKIIRKKTASGEIDENDFDQIYPEIVKLEQLSKSQNDQQKFTNGIMKKDMLIEYMNKELDRAKRYKIPLSVLGFTLVKIKAKAKLTDKNFSKRRLLETLLNKLVEVFRTPDIIGEAKQNHFIVMLPMADQGEANLALRRAMKILHLAPLDVDGTPFEIKVAGVVADLDMMDTANAASLVEDIRSKLKDMATRITNLHAY